MGNLGRMGRSHRGLLDSDAADQRERPGRIGRTRREQRLSEGQDADRLDAPIFEDEEDELSDEDSVGVNSGRARPGRVSVTDRHRQRLDQAAAAERRGLKTSRAVTFADDGELYGDSDDDGDERSAGRARPARLGAKARPPKVVGEGNLFQSVLEHPDGTMGGAVHHVDREEEDAEEEGTAVCAEISVSSPGAGFSPWELARQKSMAAGAGGPQASKLVLTRKELATVSNPGLSALSKLGIISRGDMAGAIAAQQSAGAASVPGTPATNPLALGSGKRLTDKGVISGLDTKPSRPRTLVGRVTAGLYAVTLAPLARLFGFGRRKRALAGSADGSAAPKIERTWDLEENENGEIVMEIDAINPNSGEVQAVKITLDAEQERAIFGMPNPYDEQPEDDEDDDNEDDDVEGSGGNEEEDEEQAAGRALPARVRGKGGRAARFAASTAVKPAELKLQRGKSAFQMYREEIDEDGEDDEEQLAGGRALPARVRGKGGRAARFAASTAVKPAELKKGGRGRSAAYLYGIEDEEPTSEANAGRALPKRLQAKGRKGGSKAFKNYGAALSTKNLFKEAVHHPDGTTGGRLHRVERARLVIQTFGFDEQTDVRNRTSSRARMVNQTRRSMLERRFSSENWDDEMEAAEEHEEAAFQLELQAQQARPVMARRWDQLRQEAAMARHTLTPEQLQGLSVGELHAVRSLGVISEWRLQQLLARKRALRPAATWRDGPSSLAMSPGPQRTASRQAMPPGLQRTASRQAMPTAGAAMANAAPGAAPSSTPALASRLPQPTSLRPSSGVRGSGRLTPANAGVVAASPLDIKVQVCC